MRRGGLCVCCYNWVCLIVRVAQLDRASASDSVPAITSPGTCDGLRCNEVDIVDIQNGFVRVADAPTELEDHLCQPVE